MPIDFRARGVRINAISPGIINAEPPGIERFKEMPHMMAFWRQMPRLDRLERSEEVAAAALFLASNDASYARQFGGPSEPEQMT